MAKNERYSSQPFYVTMLFSIVFVCVYVYISAFLCDYAFEHNVCFYMSIHLYAWYICMPVCPWCFVLSIYLYACLSVVLCVYVYISVCLSVRGVLCICLYICMPVCPWCIVYMSIYLHACLSVVYCVYFLGRFTCRRKLTATKLQYSSKFAPQTCA